MAAPKDLYSLIDVLSSEKDTWKIKVKVLRLWKSFNTKDNNIVMSLDMILLDEHGTTIQGSVRKFQIMKFEKQLQEGKVYFLQNLKIVPAAQSYRPVRNDKKIPFLLTTIITPIDEIDCGISTHKFDFVDFKSLSERCYNVFLLSDIVGKVIAISSMNEIEVNGTMWKKVEMEMLVDNDKMIYATAWGNSAMVLDDSSLTKNGEPFVIILTSTTVKKYMGKYAVSTTTSSQIYLNLKIPEVVVFLNKFEESETPIKKLLNEDDNEGLEQKI
ncbi:hypothetical protein M5689_018941 [Euphorbia peplus]|nr:hypothetical protein M5689_018941 [Euphorbia peplus]